MNTMAAWYLNLFSFLIFDLTKKDTLKTRWNKHLKRFNIWCIAIDDIHDGRELSMLLTYIGNETYEIYKNIITVEEPTLTQVNAAFEAHFAPTSRSAYKYYF